MSALTNEPVFLTIEKDLLYSITNGDIDEDNIPDIWEEENGLRWINSDDNITDLDHDGLANYQEYEYKTDPNEHDTDKDGYDDGVEITEGTDPTDISSYPNNTPTNFKATRTGNEIVLNWDKIDIAKSYTVYMSQDANWADMPNMADDAITYDDISVNTLSLTLEQDKLFLSSHFLSKR